MSSRPGRSPQKLPRELVLTELTDEGPKRVLLVKILWFKQIHKSFGLKVQ